MHAGDFPDPSVMEWLGVYYGFATQNFAPPSQTINIQVSTSSNGVDWSQQSGVDALPTVGSWAMRGNTWAPSVVRNNTDNDFVMYYTATEIQTGDQCIGMATSLLPEGPYTDNSIATHRLPERGRLQRPDGRQHRRLAAAASTRTSSRTRPGTTG